MQLSVWVTLAHPAIQPVDEKKGVALESGAMRYRLATPDDAPNVVELLRRDGGFRLDRDLLPDWPELVRELTRRCPTNWIVWEDTRSNPVTPVAFGGSAFVEERLLAGWLADGKPYPSNHLLRGLRDGTAAPLEADAIRAGNRGAGLALMVVHFVLAHRSLDHPVIRRFMPAGNAAWYFAHGGYNLNSVCFEVYGAEYGAFMAAGGYELWNDYSGNREAAEAPAELRPAMYGQRRDRMPVGAMFPPSLMLFNVQPPLLDLKPSEQRIALRALLGYTDARIAEILGLSAETVRKAWIRIFSAAEQVLPALFEADASSGSRGPEKRRLLIEYLRVHMEELRPW